jgi:Dyp-type peroxidase family
VTDTADTATAATTAAPLANPTPADLEDIQGLVYSAWADHAYAAFIFATFGPDTGTSRAWLAAIACDITPAAKHKRPLHGRLQIAFTPTGLEALGVPKDVIGGLPQEATQGMHARARILGDDPANTWQLGAPGDRLDVLVMIYARTAETRAEMLAKQRAALTAAGATLRPDEVAFPLGAREHFGFADGLSQPFLPGSRDPLEKGEDILAAGEIVLGYPNEYAAIPHSPTWDDFDLGHNGSYLVFRKLAQHVETLWGYLRGEARKLTPSGKPDEVDAMTDYLGAKMMGRWRSGASLVHSPSHDDPAFSGDDVVNDFAYLDADPLGLRCPISSHVRRANPRDARGGGADESRKVVNRHRILRRGRSFGAPIDIAQAKTGVGDGQARGLYFLCLQTSIARGFEFIQQTWLSSPGFHGLHTEPDPIMGNSDGNCPFTIPASPVRLRLHAVPTVVTVLGGGYFFLPSLKALARIARGPDRE